MGFKSATLLSIRAAGAGAALLAGCVQVPHSPDADYRQAFQNALITRQCDGEAVNGMWAAYDRWYGVATAIAGYDRSDEAAALLRQGREFGLLGCPAVARASYAALLQRFPDPSFQTLRDHARQALQALPPPAPPPGAPVPIRPAVTTL